MINIKATIAAAILGFVGPATGASLMIGQNQQVVGEDTLVPFGVMAAALIVAVGSSIAAGRWIERVVQLQRSNAARIARIELRLGIPEDDDD